MVRLFVRHTVENFAKWKQGYDAFFPKATAMGVMSGVVYQAVDNSEDVTVLHDFETLEAATSFVNSADLKTAMTDAGVNSEPQIWFVKSVE